MDLSNYVDVATRLKMALEQYPELRIQETNREFVEVGDRTALNELAAQYKLGGPVGRLLAAADRAS